MKAASRFAIAALLAVSGSGSVSAAVLDLSTLVGGGHHLQDEVLTTGSFFATSYFAPIALTARFTDVYVQGDEYGIYINGLLVFEALSPLMDGSFSADPDAAFVSGKFASGLVNLVAGDILSFKVLRIPVGYTDATIAVSVGLPRGATAVPEPASWAMLIAGFGLTGAAMRRRVALKSQA